MIYSMTGFGKAEQIFEAKKITIEIKSVNGKQSDINIRMPSIYRSVEMNLRKMIIENLIRGKIDVYITVENIKNRPAVHINSELAIAYAQEIQDLSQKINAQPVDLTALLLQMPDVLQSHIDEISEKEYKTLTNILQEALNQCITFRKQEGDALKKDIIEHIEKIKHLIPEIEQYEQERISKIKSRLQEAFEKLHEIEADKNRFEQELIYYIEKFDINEEKVRLMNHCNYLLDTINDNNIIAKGRKIQFIGQEIGREINTIGSKAHHAQIQKIVVQMKDYLERIKEQSLNIL